MDNYSSDEIIESLITQGKECEDELKRILSQLDLESTLCATFLFEFNKGGGKYTESSHGHLSFYIESLIYLMKSISQHSQKTPTVEQIANISELLTKYLVPVTMLTFAEEVDTNSIPIEIIQSVRNHARIVRGSAYPEQTSSKIIGVHEKVKGFCKNEFSSTPEDLVNCLWVITTLMEEAFNLKLSKNTSTTNQENWNDIYLTALEYLPITKEKIIENGFTEETINSLIELIGLQLTDDMTVDYLYIRNHPITILNNNTILLFDLSNSLDALWNSLEQKIEKSPYKDKYIKARGDWLEEVCASSLIRVFGSDNVYRNVDYSDPYKEGGVANLDILVDWKPFLLLCEAKAGKFRAPIKETSASEIKTDIKRR